MVQAQHRLAQMNTGFTGINRVSPRGMIIAGLPVSPGHRGAGGGSLRPPRGRWRGWGRIRAGNSLSPSGLRTTRGARPASGQRRAVDARKGRVGPALHLHRATGRPGRTSRPRRSCGQQVVRGMSALAGMKRSSMPPTAMARHRSPWPRPARRCGCSAPNRLVTVHQQRDFADQRKHAGDLAQHASLVHHGSLGSRRPAVPGQHHAARERGRRCRRCTRPPARGSAAGRATPAVAAAAGSMASWSAGWRWPITVIFLRAVRSSCAVCSDWK